ncbi:MULTISPECIES: 3D domain-containing protein [Niallia]|jgi:3D (Asp-Asp-Asp) domain-containing protein|uniref:3D domain-containing protein n=1 Tax=Niallia TaxID=2837506 RepID=UPI000F457A53|nr:3D domain-containing protein [Niallia circulans]AYV69285.1 radical SAM protein [Niallia circulans]AYV72321.1 radical SAM protein [Niallia circulans]NRG27793.1 radical SAM protein [Niallia circulans]QJX60760.1 radical SAM protein [Niallia circulans]
MRSLKKLMAISLSSVIFLTSAIMVQAETSQETLNKAKNQLDQNQQLINEKEAEKQKTLKELEAVQEELKSIETVMQQNKDKIANLQVKIEETQQQIEKKKEEIVVLEDKVLARKDVMKDRLVSLQNTDQTNVVLEVLFNSKDFADFLSRATAISMIFDGDKDILEQQQADLQKIEEEKAAIDQQEEELTGQYDELAATQNELQQNVAQRQEAVTAVQKKYASVSKEVELAESQKKAVLDQIGAAESALKKEQEEAKKVVKVNSPAKKVASASTKSKPTTSKASSSKSSSRKDVIYVTSTAYSHQDTKSDFTALGYNIKKNKNMKLIAVDPAVIPLGSKVWVEGYGEAVAGDTGGAIKGHKIDVLMPSTSKAKAWGRKTVKIKILD